MQRGASSSTNRVRARRRDGHERAERLLAAVEERARGERRRAPARTRRRRGSATRTTCGRSRSQPRRAARPSSAAPSRRAARSSKKSLIRFFSVSRSSTWIFLIATAAWFATARREVDARVPLGDERAEQLVARDERHRDPRRAPAAAELRPELAQARSSRASPRRRADRPAQAAAAPRPARADRGGTRVAPSSSTAAATTSVRARRSSRRARPPRRARSGARARRRAAASRRRAGRSRSRPATSDALETRNSTSASVNSRGASVSSGDRADRIAAPAEDRHRDERLEPLLLELGHVLHARIVERVVADERRLAGARAPTRRAPPRARARSCRRAGAYGGDAARSTSRSPSSLDEIDEAGVHGARVGEQPHDAARGPPRDRATTPTVEMISCSTRASPAGAAIGGS